MKALYDADIDLLEVIEEGRKSIGKRMTDSLTVFIAERGGAIIGFQLEGASIHTEDLELVPIGYRISAIFRLVRGLLGLSQKEFAEKLDVDARTISRLETGESANPSFDNLVGLRDAAPRSVDVSVLLRKDRDASEMIAAR